MAVEVFEIMQIAGGESGSIIAMDCIVIFIFFCGLSGVASFDSGFKWFILLFKGFMLLLVIVLVWICGGCLSLMRACKNVGLRMPRSKAYLQVSRSLCLESLISLGL